MHFSHSVTGIELSAIKRLELMGRSVPGVVSLAQGIPSFDTPAHIRQAAIDAIGQGLVDRYTVGYGIDPLRQAIVHKLARDNDIHVSESCVTVTHGAIEAIMAVLLTTLDQEDEVIFLTPDYASHLTQSLIVQGGARPVCVTLDESHDWSFVASRLENVITPRTRALLICNPSNPLGKVYTRDELAQIVEICARHNIVIISDETYEYFTFDRRRHVSIASLPGAADITISIFSLSKSYAMTGWRIGYIVASPKVSEQVLKVHDSMVTCPAAVSQYAALAAITGPQDEVVNFCNQYEHRRNIVCDAIDTTPKLSLLCPQGGYFAFVKVLSDINDVELCTKLIHEAGVAVVPGSAFGDGGAGHIRISFGCDEARLTEGLARLTQYVDSQL